LKKSLELSTGFIRLPLSSKVIAAPESLIIYQLIMTRFLFSKTEKIGLLIIYFEVHFNSMAFSNQFLSLFCAHVHIVVWAYKKVVDFSNYKVNLCQLI